MNRKLYVGIMSFFAVVFTISILFLPFYNPIYFYLQHVSLFLFMAMFIYYLLKLGYDRLEKRIIKKNILKGYTITLLVLVLFGFSSLQLSFIETYQTKDQQHCTYYDSFGNLVFESYQPTRCPELEVIERQGDVFIFSITENYEGEAENGYMNLDIDKVYSFTGTKTSKVSIRYNNSHYVENVVVESESKILLSYQDEEYKIYNYFKHSIENQILLNNQGKYRVESKQIKEVIKDTFVDYEQEDEISALQAEFEYKMYSSTKFYNDQESDYQIVLEEGLFTNSSFSTLISNSTIYSIIDAYTNEGIYELRIGEYNFTHMEIDFETLGFGNERADSYIKYDIHNIEIGQPYYFINGNETRVTTYNKFPDVDSYRGWIIASDMKPTAFEIFYSPLERSSFTYNGKDYMEHGGYYTVFTIEDYGMSLSTKSAQNDEESYRVPYLYWVSIDNNEAAFDDEFISIYDYRHGFNEPYNENDTQVYQWSPLVFFLIDWSLYEK